MKVKDAMTYGVQTCHLDTNLAEAAMQMWRGDFGILPVVGHTGKVMGMITDRDICMAAATKHREATKIRVSEVISGKVYTCSPDTEIHEALKIMRNNKVRRLPIVNADDGKLTGILSLNDLALKARESRDPSLTAQDVEETLSAICAHPSLPLAKPARQAVSEPVPV